MHKALFVLVALFLPHALSSETLPPQGSLLQEANSLADAYTAWATIEQHRLDSGELGRTIDLAERRAWYHVEQCFKRTRAIRSRIESD